VPKYVECQPHMTGKPWSFINSLLSQLITIRALTAPYECPKEQGDDEPRDEPPKDDPGGGGHC